MVNITALATFLLLVGVGCGPGATGETPGGVFFPTWSEEEAPTGAVLGPLIERDGCLFLFNDPQETLLLWDDAYSYENGAVLNSSGNPVVRVGEIVYGGGGYIEFSVAQRLAEQTIPERCQPSGPEAYALIYAVESRGASDS